MSTKIQCRRGTAAAWTAANPVLLAGEPGFETDTGLEKRGDGVTAWTSLGYFMATRYAQVEPYTAPYTVYVNQANGSDANTGNSPGQAYATLAKAINQLQQVGQHPGRIVIITYGAGDLTLSSPVSVVQKMWIEAIGPSAVGIDRNFSTPNGRSVWDAVTTAAGSTVTSATAAFTNADNARIVSVYGAGVGGGTYYDFVNGNPPNGTTANLTATTALARNSTTDPLGVKMSIVGDWNRVVTDASMVSGGSVVTSVSAAWTTADIGTEIVIAGAGQGGQALRSAIKFVSGNTATILAVSSGTISNKRCAIRVNFGDLFTFHAGQGGLRNLLIQDTSTGNGSIGATIKLISDDGGAGSALSPADLAFENLRITSQDAAGAWEHIIDVDGSWNQSNGPGVRRFNFHEPKLFGSRKPGETVRIVSAVHGDFVSCGSEGSAPTSFEQGIVILDPANNGGGRGGPSSQDVNFTGCEGDAWCFYSEGWNCTFQGDRLNMGFTIAGRQVIRLGPTSNYNMVSAPNQSTVGGSITSLNADEYDAGTNNLVQTQKFGKRPVTTNYDQYLPTSPAISYETVSRRAMRNDSQVVGSSGVLVLQSIWLPGGAKISRLGLVGGGAAVAWGSGWTGPHFIFGLYDPDGNLFGQSADTGGTQVFNAVYSNDIINIAKDGAGNSVSSVLVPRTGMCFIGLLVNSGTGGSGFTYPTFVGIGSSLAAIVPPLAGTSGSGLTALSGSVTVPLTTGINSILYGGVG